MLLEAEGVVKEFGSFRAVDGANIRLDKGDIVGLIGPNGAGKSTFFNCLAGDFRPTEGRITLHGEDITCLTPEEHAMRGLARTWQVPTVFEDMTVLENIMTGAFIRHASRHDARAKAEEVLAFTELRHLTGTRAGTLGTPARKRLEIARALATEPEVLLLDEALAGLTPTEARAAVELVRAIHGRGIAIVIVEHLMEVILSLAHRVIVFNQGRVIAEGEPRPVMERPEVIEAYLGRSMRRRGKPA